MSVRGPNSVGKAVQTDPTLLRYASAITKQKKCWELLAEKFDWFQTLHNNTQQHPTTCNRVCKRTQHVTTDNIGSCWAKMLRPFARSLILILRPQASWITTNFFQRWSVSTNLSHIFVWWTQFKFLSCLQDLLKSSNPWTNLFWAGMLSVFLVFIIKTQLW